MEVIDEQHVNKSSTPLVLFVKVVI